MQTFNNDIFQASEDEGQLCLQKIKKCNIYEILQEWEYVEFKSVIILWIKVHEVVGRPLLCACTGFLSNLSISGGTNCNDSQHRVLQKTLNKNQIDTKAVASLLGGDYMIPVD